MNEADLSRMFMNAKQAPQVYYGLHMVPGACRYPEMKDGQGQPLMVLLNGDTCKEMDATFPGKPMFVRHITTDVNLDTIQRDADGYVVESFFNSADGCHWIKFIAVSDGAHEAIRNKWRLSNAYKPKDFGTGGNWHAIPYSKQILRAEYHHCAFVPDPRYEESIILTPDEFKLYNEKKVTELKRLENSITKEPKKMGLLKMFAKKEIDASSLDGAMITLSNGKEVSLAQLIKNAEEAPMPEKKPIADPLAVKADSAPPAKVEEPAKVADPAAPVAEKKVEMANGEHMVKVGEEQMSVNELVARHGAMKDCMNGVKKNSELPAKVEEVKKNEEPVKKDEPVKNSYSKEEVDALVLKATGKLHFDLLANAPATPAPKAEKLEMESDRLARGKSMFGSN